MSMLIVFFSSGLFVYWLTRSWLLCHGSDDEIDATLEADYWWGRNLVTAFRAIFLPPPQAI